MAKSGFRLAQKNPAPGQWFALETTTKEDQE